MYVAAIVGRVIRVHEGDPNATEMKEYTVAKRAEVTLNGKKVGLADLNNGDEVKIQGGTNRGFTRIEAIRSKDSQFAVQSQKRDLSKPQIVEAVQPEAGLPVAQWVDKDTPPEEVGVHGDSTKRQPPFHTETRTGHKRTGEEGANEGITSGPTGGGTGEGEGPVTGVPQGTHSKVVKPTTHETRTQSGDTKKGDKK